MKTISTTVKTLAFVLLSSPAMAGYSIVSHGSTGGSIFKRLVKFMQDTVDFMDGPLAVGVMIIGVVVAGCMWIFAPDNRHLGKAMKAIAVGFVLFDIGLLINYIRA